MVKNLLTNAGDAGDGGSVLGLGRIPWRSEWQPTSIFLPGKSHRQRSLVGFSSGGRKEVDTTEHACMCTTCLYKKRVGGEMGGGFGIGGHI